MPGPGRALKKAGRRGKVGESVLPTEWSRMLLWGPGALALFPAAQARPRRAGALRRRT
ncbi:hypothetical protein KL86CLO1_12520 [uncultured Eubacteriales bacterium]|uniref:Uncharacterized protein n=1 Tax=uncultured Eubacteriales bacterium TaxID=172733 RepID=A0A212KAQ9_9FIRM|nr:hypothetical protein KL86CLO1_12520 [uncultured Eubacteriales bacterium]